MNILIIDDLFVPESAKANSSEKVLFCLSAKENSLRRVLLAKEFEKLGANVLLARFSLCKSDLPLSFEYREEGGVSQLFVKIPARKNKNFLRLPELFSFGTALFENSPGLAGIFEPDVVIAGGVLPFSFSAGAKIAECSNAVFITELFCLPAEVLKCFGLCPALSPVLTFLKKSTA